MYSAVKLSPYTAPSKHDAPQVIYHGQGVYYLGSQRRVGHELLLRSCGDYSLADMLAEPLMFVHYLDEMTNSKLKHAQKLCKNSKRRLRIFVNFTPSQISSSKFTKVIDEFRRFCIQHAQVVIEVTEHESISKHPKIIQRLNLAKSNGIEIALDDFGAGYANLESLAELKPDFVKVDKKILNNATVDKFGENLIYSLVRFINNLGVKAVLEGVETERHMQIAIKSRAELGQGFHLEKPCPI